MMFEMYARQNPGGFNRNWTRVKINLPGWDKINRVLKAKLEFLGPLK
jgi:hypothetical protein